MEGCSDDLSEGVADDCIEDSSEETTDLGTWTVLLKEQLMASFSGFTKEQRSA